MKVLAINGSPHKNGNTAYAISVVADQLKSEGIDVDIIHIGNQPIRGCLACATCYKTKDETCVIKTDKVNEYIQLMKNADGLIIGSPVHFASMSATLKCLLDRAFYVAGANGSLFRHKVASAVVAVRRGGGMTTFDQLMNYPLYAEMVVPTANYWNVIHGRTEGEAAKDEEGIQVMRMLGKNMAWLLKLIENGKGKVTEPAPEPKTMMSFIR